MQYRLHAMTSQTFENRSPTRTVIHSESIQWLTSNINFENCSFITSLPDISEFPHLNLNEWKKWFTNAAQIIMDRCPHDALSLFFQTDIKVDGAWIDKGYLCQLASESANCKLIFHKVICRLPPDKANFGRPGYSHLLGFSKSNHLSTKHAFPDVISDPGKKTWTRGMGTKVCELACKIVKTHTESTTIVDPFCGHGSVLRAANKLGFNAIGIDHSAKSVRKSQSN